MAIGYERLNTSSARTRRNNSNSNKSADITVTAAGVIVDDPMFGRGVTLDAFVASSDRVRVEFSAGIVVMRGEVIALISYNLNGAKP